MFRKATLCALSALLITASPAPAAPRPAISDGFVASGVAGSQVRVRVTKDLLMPDYTGRREVVARASSGPFGGFAMHAADGHAGAYVVEATSEWTCGKAACPRSKPRYAVMWSSKKPYDLLPKGDYIFVLLGAPGSRVDVVLPPIGRERRSTTVRMTRTAPVHLTPTDDIAPGHDLGVDATASGKYVPQAQHGTVLMGIVHTVEAWSDVSVELSSGLAGWDGKCYGASMSASRTARAEDGRYDPLEPVYRTTALLSFEKRAGDRCAAWEGSISQVRGTQRAIGVSVPIVV